MVTASVILAALLILALLVVVIGQMCSSGTMWFVHAINGTPGILCELFVACMEALFGSE